MKIRRRSYPATIILPEGMTLELFDELINEALSNSDYVDTYISQGTDLFYPKDYELKALLDRDLIYEFKKRKA